MVKGLNEWSQTKFILSFLPVSAGQEAGTHVNIITDGLGTWKERPVGYHDYPKSFQSV